MAGGPRTFGDGPDWNAVSLVGFKAPELLALRQSLDSLGMTVRDLLRYTIERELERVTIRKAALEGQLTKLLMESR